jgi:hypothetical protein
MSVNVKELFSHIKVDKLKELAQRHNVEYNIKAPSTMLKAELIKSLADHYINLLGNELVPVPARPMKLAIGEIPGKFQIKNPKDTKKKILLNLIGEREVEMTPEKAEQYKKWMEQMQQSISKGKDDPYEIKKQRREARNESYITKKKLDEAIEKRKKNLEKAKEYRLKKKTEALQQKPEKKKEPEKELTPGEKMLGNFKVLLKETEKLYDMEGDAEGIKFYEETNSKYDNLWNKYKAMKNQFKQKEKDKIEEVIDEIKAILDDDDVFDKFV